MQRFLQDFMLDAAGPNNKVWLLEANPDPSLGMFGQGGHNDIVGGDPLNAVPEDRFEHVLTVSPLLEAMRALKAKRGKSSGRS